MRILGIGRPSAAQRLRDARINLEAQQLKLRSAVTAQQQRMTESLNTYWDNYVDPREAYWDDDEKVFWLPLDSSDKKKGMPVPAYRNEDDLRFIRDQGRRLATLNEFAINAHENRISYLVGEGFNYEVASRDGEKVSEQTLADVQRIIDNFIEAAEWSELEQELVLRADRDGEYFLRFFPQTDGTMMVRTIEPEEVATPNDYHDDASKSLGVETDPDDVQTVIGYFIKGEDQVPSDEIQHVKMNVDRNSKRGVPTMFPIRKNLDRAEKLLRNMGMVTAIQAAIAMIRKHVSGMTKTQVSDFADDQADFSINNETTGKTTRFQQIGPAEIIDAPKGIEYEFPGIGVDAAKGVAVLQAELRAAASRLVMPEFMFTSDASNANYASTLVSEGPTVKMFRRLQAFFVRRFKRVMRRVLEHAAYMGLIPERELERIAIKVDGPNMVVRDRLKEAQACELEHDNGIRSKRSWAASVGLDYDEELAELEKEDEGFEDPYGDLRVSPQGSASATPKDTPLPPDGSQGEGDESEDDAE